MGEVTYLVKYVVSSRDPCKEKLYPVIEDAVGYHFPWRDDKGDWHEGFVPKWAVAEIGEIDLITKNIV